MSYIAVIQPVASNMDRIAVEVVVKKLVMFR